MPFSLSGPLLRPILSSGSLWVVSRILDFQLPRSFISNNGLCPFFWSSVFLVQDLYTKHMRRRSSIWRLLINDCNKMLNFSLQGWKKGMATCNFSRGQLLKTEKITHLWIFRCSNFEKFIPFSRSKFNLTMTRLILDTYFVSEIYCVVSKLWFVHLQFLSMAATMNLMESENAIKENSILFCIKNLRGLFFSSK